MSYQVIFALNFLLVFAAMKLASWLSYSTHNRGPLLPFLIGTPFLSAKPKMRPYHHAPSILVIKFILSISMIFFLKEFIENFMLPLEYWEVIYICPLVYLVTETIGTFGQLLFFTKDIPPLHYHPLKSKTLGEFWGKRWNVWVQDWLRDVSGKRKRSLHQNMAITFFISGFFHEIMFNLPYAIYSGTFYFGNMFLYFFIQALGLWVEKKWLKGSSLKVRRVYLWIVVVIPSPIFMMKSFLLFLGIDNG